MTSSVAEAKSHLDMSYEMMKWRRQDLIALGWNDNLDRPMLLQEKSVVYIIKPCQCR